MKIFISHQQRDSLAAASIAKRLQDIHSVQYYLDLIDNDASQTGELLGDHIKRQLSSCTQWLLFLPIQKNHGGYLGKLGLQRRKTTTSRQL
jgi:hypothetical protein